MDKGSAWWRWKDANLSHRAVAEKASGFHPYPPNYQLKHHIPITFTPHFITNVYRLNNGDNEKNRRVIVLMNHTASLTSYEIPAACALKAIRITRT